MMHFSILHLSDLHRDVADELETDALLNSLERDAERYDRETPPIRRPAVCIVTGPSLSLRFLRSTSRDARSKRSGHQGRCRKPWSWAARSSMAARAKRLPRFWRYLSLPRAQMLA